MSYLNKVTIIGDLIKEPYYEVDKIANLRVATFTQYKNKEGEVINKRNVHNVIVFEKNYIKYIKNSIYEGDKVFLEGEISYRTHIDKNEQKRTVLDIIINNNIGYLSKIKNTKTIQPEKNYDDVGKYFK